MSASARAECDRDRIRHIRWGRRFRKTALGHDRFLYLTFGGSAVARHGSFDLGGREFGGGNASSFRRQQHDPTGMAHQKPRLLERAVAED